MAMGTVSPELMAQCSQQMEPEPGETPAVNIDYDQASITALKQKFEGASASICEAMHLRCLWPRAPHKPVLETHLPSGLPAEDLEEEVSGLPFPQELGAHITEMWSRPNLKPCTKGGPGKLWQAYYDRFCALSVSPSTEELRQLQLDLKSFKDKAVRLGLQVPAEFLRTKLRSAIASIRLQANMGALAQYQSQETSSSGNIVEALVALFPLDNSKLADAQHLGYVLQQNLAGLAISAWASNALSFSMADGAAREVYSTVQSLRKNALWTLFGKSCPQIILDRLVHLPIQAGSMFGPSFAREIPSLAKDQSCLSTLSAAVVQLGGSNLEGATPKTPRPLNKQTVKFAGFKPPLARNPARKQPWGGAWAKQNQSPPANKARGGGRRAQPAAQQAPQPRAPKPPKQQLQQQQQLQAPQWAQPQAQQWPQQSSAQAQWPQLQEPAAPAFQEQAQGYLQSYHQTYPQAQAQPFRGGRGGGRRNKRGGGRGAGGGY